VVVAVAALTACGGAAPEQTASPSAVVEQAAAAMAAAGSARYTVHGTVRNKDISNRALPFTAKGQSRFDGKQAWIWWDVSNIFPVAIAHSAPATERADLRRFLEDPDGWHAELRIRGKTSWMRIPALTDLVGSKPWLEGGEEDDVELGPESAWIDPGGLIAYLRALRHVEEVGAEESGTHYRGRVELKRIAALAPKRSRARLQKLVRQVAEQTGKRAVPLDIWIADGNLPVRFRVTVIEPRSGGDRYPTTWKSTIDVLEYGVDFDVLRPPARKVMTDQEFEKLTES
jgi:hypothetical protein